MRDPAEAVGSSGGRAPVIFFNGIVHWVDGGEVIASRGHELWRSGDEGNHWTLFASLPQSVSARLRATTRLTRRLFRAGVHHVVRVASGQLVVVASTGIYRLSGDTGEVLGAPCAFAGSRPLALCDAGLDTLFFGEYRSNPKRAPVHVWGSFDGGARWEPVHRFEGVRHVHGIYRDSYTGALWVTTGDSDSEAGIWVTDDSFRSVRLVASGSQRVRAIQLLFTREHVYFGSDSPLEANFLYRLCRRTQNIEPLQAVGGSVFFGCKVGERLVFSTACEPSVVNGSREAEVWCSDTGETWSRILAFRKDHWPMKLFQYGQVRFPSGVPGAPHLWFTPFATEHDQTSARLALPADGSAIIGQPAS